MGKRYIIKSNEEKDDDGTPLFWSNEDGWVDRESATRFSASEKARLHLPLSGEWVNEQQRRV